MGDEQTTKDLGMEEVDSREDELEGVRSQSGRMTTREEGIINEEGNDDREGNDEIDMDEGNTGLDEGEESRVDVGGLFSDGEDDDEIMRGIQSENEEDGINSTTVTKSQVVQRNDSIEVPLRQQRGGVKSLGQTTETKSLWARPLLGSGRRVREFRKMVNGILMRLSFYCVVSLYC